MSTNISEAFELLFAKNNSAAYKALRELEAASAASDSVYRYMDKLIDLLDDANSYIRTRALTLIACNAQWDKDCKIDEIIDKYLRHITDVRPITARQCIKNLPKIAAGKPDLKQDVIRALEQADISIYADSMRPLVYKDIQQALKEIQRLP